MDKIFFNGCIRTLDENDNIYEAVGVKDGKIAFLGTNEEAEHIKCKEKINLLGRLMLPGFVDTHLHMLNYAFVEKTVRLFDCKSVEECLDRAKETFSKAEGKLTWLCCRGWNETHFEYPRYPTKAELDAISMEIPIIMVRVCGHIAVCNSCGLERLKKTKEFPEISQYIDMETGLLKENAVQFYYSVLETPTQEEVEDYIKYSMKKLNEGGFTGIQSDDLASLPGKDWRRILAAFQNLDAKDQLTLRIYEQCLFERMENGKAFIWEGFRTGQKGKYFTIGPMKLLQDGSLGAMTAAMNEPYEGHPKNRGINIYSQEELDDLFRFFDQHEMQAAVHCIGDRAMDMTLEAIAKSPYRKENPKNRHGIVHVQISNPRILERMKEQDVLAYIQPVFVDLDMGVVEERIGTHRMDGIYAWKTMLDMGIHAVGGSDAPVVSFNIMENIYFAVTRKNIQGQPEEGWISSERMSVDEAVKLFTKNAAYASYTEKENGTLEIGKWADMVVLEKDIYEIAPEDIKTTKVDMTVLAGEVVFERVIPTMGRTNCGGRCRLLVTEKDGKIIEIKGDPKYPDKMPCIRGLNYHKTFLGEDRLTRPLKRIGKRGEGKFEPISWDEAIALITKEWVRIRDTYGPASRYVNYGWGVEGVLNGTSLAKRLLRLDGGHLDYYNDYSTACTNYTTPYLYGTKYSGSSFETLLDSKLIILWAHNPAETRFDNLMYWLRKAKKQGTEIIVIDPRKNATVKALNAKWIAIKPTTDAALMDAMAYVIWKEDLYDHFFVEERCLGFNRYFSYLNGDEDGIAKTPEWAAKITGVDVEMIKSLARRYALAGPAALLQGYGGQRHANGEQFTRGGIMLACLTGNVGVPGGWAAGAGQCHIVDFPSVKSVANPVKAQIPVFLWTDAILKGSDFTEKEGLKGAEHLDCGIKMILNLAGNMLVNQHSDINRTKKILEDESLCEFIVCSDLFMTPSARYADLVLPGTSMLEGDNITTPWNQGNFIGFCNQIVEPVGESRFEFEWLYEVAKNLGLAEQFSCGHSDYRQWLRSIYEEHRAGLYMPDYETFKKEGIYVYEDAPQIIAFEAERKGEKPFPTPSGKVEIYSPKLESLNHPRIPAVPGYVEAKEGPEKNKKYPLQLIGWHTLGRCHSVHYNNEELRAKYPQRLWMNPKDGADRGLQNGDIVEVWNERGTLLVPVYLTDEIMSGVTAIAQGAWHQTDEKGRDVTASINVLTSSEPTPLAKGNPQHTNLVEVKKSGDVN